MFTFAIATFFALALTGALLTIIAMFYGYRNKIKSVIIAGLSQNIEGNIAPDPVIVHQNHALPRCAFKTQQFKSRYSVRQPVPLRAAA